MYVCVSSCAHVCVRVCVNKIPANKVQWPGTDENPLGESLLDVDPPPTPASPPHSLPSFPLGIRARWRGRRGWGGDAQSHVSGEMNRSAVPSVSHKLGSGRSCGTLSWDEQREEGRKQLLSVFLSLLHQLTCVFPYSVISSKAVISFCYMGFK